MNDTIAAYIDGKPVLVCKKCASDEIGKQEPAFYYKKPEDPYDKWNERWEEPEDVSEVSWKDENEQERRMALHEMQVVV